MRFCGKLMTSEHSAITIITSDGSRLPWAPQKSNLMKEIMRVGAVSPRSMRKDVLVPFSEITIKVLINELPLENLCDVEQILNEISGFAKDYPEIRKIRDKICEYLLTFCKDSNCFTLNQKLIEYDCPEFSKKTLSYIKYNLIRMVKSKTIDVQFFRISVDDLVELLDDDDLHVEHETHLLDVINCWISCSPIKRTGFRPLLISKIRQKSLTAQQLVALSSFQLSEKPPRRICDVMLAVGGWLHKRATDRIEWFDESGNQWRQLKLRLPMCLAYHGAAVIDDVFYVFGGSDGIHHKCETWKWTPKTSRWLPCDNMLEARNYITNSSVVYNGKIYVFGGQDGRDLHRRTSRSNTAEMYDPTVDRWIAIASMHDMRSDAAATVYKDEIYIAGGFNGHSIISAVEVYHPQGDFYISISVLPHSLSGHTMLTHMDELLVLGGYNGTERQQKILVWSRNGWNEKEDKLTHGRSTCSSCVYRERVVIAGGYTKAVEKTCETLLSSKNDDIMVPELIQSKSAAKLVVANNWRKIIESIGSIPYDQLIPEPVQYESFSDDTMM